MTQFTGIHHHSVLVSDIDISLHFYHDVIGLNIDQNRPAKLPFKGAWLEVGSQAIHLLELPNPDDVSDRPKHGGRDRHVALTCDNLSHLIDVLEKNEIQFTRSHSGRAAIFFRDPDQNAIEVFESS